MEKIKQFLLLQQAKKDTFELLGTIQQIQTVYSRLMILQLKLWYSQGLGTILQQPVKQVLSLDSSVQMEHNKLLHFKRFGEGPQMPTFTH